jgi:Mn2+/Fe2+ NRAMP family transporter
VPVAAILVSTLVVRGGFKRVEHVLLLLATVFVTYFASGVLAHPRWGAAARGLVVPARTPSTSGFARATSRSSAWM